MTAAARPRRFPAHSIILGLRLAMARDAMRHARMRWLMLAFPASLAAQTREPSATSVAPRRCMDTIATVTPARLDDRHLIYVEQETVRAQADGRVLVAGAPVFVWKQRDGGYDLLARDSLFGMVIDSSLSVRAIPSPLPGRSLDGMRAAPLPDGWWLVTFAEVLPAQPPKAPTVLAMWAGETDGARWRSVTKLPMIADSLVTIDMSALVWRDGRARVAVPFPRDHRKLMVLYSLDDGRWTARIHDFGLMSYVALSLSTSRDLMAVVRPLEGPEVDINSLFLYAKSPSDTIWTEKSLLVHAGQVPVRDPMFSTDEPRLLAWHRHDPRSLAGEAWYASMGAVDDSASPPIRIGPGVNVSSLSSRRGRAVLAAANRAWPDPTLRLFELDSAALVGTQTIATSYRGLIGLAVTSTRVVLVAARAATSPRDPAVVSVIQTHAWRCE